jgi:hypothetical protein
MGGCPVPVGMVDTHLVDLQICNETLNVYFRRVLVGENWAKWLQLVGGILTVRLFFYQCAPY